MIFESWSLSNPILGLQGEDGMLGQVGVPGFPGLDGEKGAPGSDGLPVSWSYDMSELFLSNIQFLRVYPDEMEHQEKMVFQEHKVRNSMKWWNAIE